MPQAETAIELLTVHGWYRGYVLLPAGGRLLDYLNTRPSHIGLASVQDPAGRHHRFMAVNTDQVLAIRDRPEA
ncbi:MAG: hypothetical protein ACE147_12210 [Candidatus Methylomirabilales bacterium]